MGVRAAPALAYLVIVAAVYGLGAAMWGRRTAFAASLVYATSPFAILAANSVSTDPFLAMWEALTALAYWKALRAISAHRAAVATGQHAATSGARASGRWIILLWLFAGLGFLTKGPPALLTLLVIFIYHGWRCATRHPAPALTSPVGIPLFAVVPLAVLFTSRSRLPLYVLPFLPALTLLTGRAVAPRVAVTGRWRRALPIALVTAAVMLVVKGVAARVESRSDMRPVHELVSSAGCDEGCVYTYGLQKEHGLMFYLGRNMVRASADPVQHYAAIGAAELVAELSETAGGRSCCVVMRAEETALPELLAGAGLVPTRQEVGRYVVLTVAPPRTEGADAI